MAKTVFSFQECRFIANTDELRSINRTSESIERSSTWARNCSYEVDDWDLSKETDFGFFQILQQDQNPLSCIDSQLLHHQELDILSPHLNIHQLAGIPNQNVFSSSSLEILNKYGGRTVDGISNGKFTGRNLSTEEIIRVAGARFIQSCYRGVDISSMLNNPVRFSLSDISDEDLEHVELVELLLASAEKIGFQQFERANRLLSLCDSLSSETGTAVQRVVHYFSKALRDRIDPKLGRVAIKEPMVSQQVARFGCYQKVPFYQVARFTGIQAILENVAGAKRVHMIDLEIRHGAHWAAMMQALGSQPDSALELLKISTIAIRTSSKLSVENTGKMLASFAESMKIPFKFNVIEVGDIMELEENLFGQDPKEIVAIYSEHVLMRLIKEPNRLEHMMNLFRKMNPCVMVVMETEANINSPSFVDRFVEALFFYSTYFDCFDCCMDRGDLNRRETELLFFHEGIRNVVACEGKERWVRHVKIEVWRAFFARFGMEETELSSSSLYQANLVLKQFACGSYCTLDMNEKSLVIGWKGTPISSLSVWKFL